ncbi:PHP-associated domain-containing protein [Rubeoparvulum massiliense]|uniref:PHP-associated domain-containing protein n=1 Tax=Rubeoparvulum massiliense TaxID=1631346 RepID=UPI00065E7086|nr:PHP domain-containing protein [Rubeoparvulum massiliense]
MLIDTHMHEKTYSGDSHQALEEIVKTARERGLDAVCITDHESNRLWDEAHRYAKENGFPIFVGTEILTKEGDLVVFGLTDLPEEMLHAQDLIRLVDQAGGVCISAHPYRTNNRGLGNHLRDVEGLAGVEAFNGNTPPHHNLMAYAVATELGLPMFGASDAHWAHQVGKYATIFPDGIRDEQDLIAAIRSKEVRPAVYYEGEYISIDLAQQLHRP